MKTIYKAFRAFLSQRRQPPEEFIKKLLLKFFAKFTGKHLCRSFHFNKSPGIQPKTLLKRESVTGIFLWNFAKSVKGPILHNNSGWLLLPADLFKRFVTTQVPFTCLKLKMVTPESWNLKSVHCKQQRHQNDVIWHRSCIFIANFEQVSHFVLVFPLFNLIIVKSNAYGLLIFTLKLIPGYLQNRR